MDPSLLEFDQGFLHIMSFESKYDENKGSNIFGSNLGNSNSLGSSTHSEDEDVDSI
jgi:hypothetical protein